MWPAEFLKNENLLEAIGRRQNPDVRLRVPQSTTARPQSREGLVALSTWTHLAVVKQLKQISADTGIKQQRLLPKLSVTCSENTHGLRLRSKASHLLR